MPQKFLTSYPSRLQAGATSLLTPNLSELRRLDTSINNHNSSYERPNARPRPSYKDHRDRDRDTVSPEDDASASGREDSAQRDDVEVDDRGFVVTEAPLDPDSDEAVGKFRYRQPGWIRVRSDYVLSHCCHAEDNLIPIRLDLDINSGHRLKDVFLWNLNEELITPTEFALNLVTDLNLPPQSVHEIARDIRKQLSEYAPVATSKLPFAKNIESDARTAPVIVDIDVHLSRHLVTDKFQWDLCNDVAVEEFVRHTCDDLGLFGEFSVALSCAIREQLMKLKKEVIESPHGLAGLIEINNSCAYDEPAGLRITNTLGIDWVPGIEILTREEIEKRDMERDRVVRRLRRDTSRFHAFGSTTPQVPIVRKRGRPREDRSRADTPDQLNDFERTKWKCANCRISGVDTWDVKNADQEFCRFCAPPTAEQILQQAAGTLQDTEDLDERQLRIKWRKNLFSTRHLINNPQWTGR